MDVHDRSSDPWVLEVMEYWQGVLDEALERKGQSVSYYHPPDQLTSRHLKSVEVSRQAIAMGAELSPLELNWSISLLPPPYLPCEQRITDLEPMFIKNMKLETHHRGRRVLVKVLTPGLRTLGDMAVVEDEHGTALTLFVSHQPAKVHPEEFMQTGDVFLLKEPFLARELAEETDEYWDYRLRVDHLCDIVKLTGVDEMIPEKWKRTLEANSKVLRAQGNEAAKKKKWAEAFRLYESAIEAAGEDPEDRRLAHLNRSLVNLHLGRAAHARKDAKHGSNISPPPEKGLYRESLALYELGGLVRSLECLERILISSPDHATTQQAIERVQARLHEQREGAYDFTEMYRQAEQTPPFIDCATYSAPVEVRPSPGQGRGSGLFTKQAVSVGQLLLCEKAFGYSYVDPSKCTSTNILLNMATKKAYKGGQADLLQALIQKLHHGPRKMREAFGELYRGDFEGSAVVEVDGTPIVDSFLVGSIMVLNCSNSWRTSVDVDVYAEMNKDIMSHLDDSDYEGDCDARSCGLWLLASRLNHACISNCSNSFIGDMQIIRATRNLEAGSELFLEHRPPRCDDTYSEVQAELRSCWGFTCTCELCQSLKETSDETHTHRDMLSSKLGDIIRKSNENYLVDATGIIKEIEGTYKPGETALGVFIGCYYVGEDMVDREYKLADCIKLVVQGLGALGFDIEAIIPDENRKASLKVRRWGYMHFETPWAFWLLFMAYKEVGPAACDAARRYVGLAYRAMFGAEERILEEFPEFK